MKSTERNTGSRARAARRADDRDAAGSRVAGRRAAGARAALLLALFCVAALCLAGAGCRSAPRPNASAGTLQGIVFDLDKTPVGGALIELEGEGGRSSAVTDSQGRFSIPDLEAGDYRLSLSKAMYERRAWPVSLGDFAEVLYLQAASYWQLLDAALEALGRKDLGEAEDFIGRARTIQEKSSTSLFLEGVLAERRGDLEAALGDLEAAADLDPRSPYLWLYLADLRERSGGEPSKAAEALGRYLELRDDPAAEERRKALEAAGR